MTSARENLQEGICRRESAGSVVRIVIVALLRTAALFAPYVMQLPERKRNWQDAEEEDLDQQVHGCPWY